MVRKVSLTLTTVFELSVLLSVLCENDSQLATAAPRLQEMLSYQRCTGTHVATDLETLFRKPSFASIMQNAQDAYAVFSSIWLLESLVSERPGHMLEYVERHTRIIMRWGTIEKAPTCVQALLCLTDIVHRTLLYGHYREFREVLSSPQGNMQWLPLNLRHALTPNHCFWPVALACRLVPKVRKTIGAALRRAYLQIPIHYELANYVNHVQGEKPSQPAPNQASLLWLESILLMDFASPRIQARRIMFWIGEQLGLKTWDAVADYVRPRIVSTSGAYALKLR